MRSIAWPNFCARDRQRGDATVKNFWKLLFKPHDGTRREMLEEVVQARRDMEKAASRLEYVIRRLIVENDRLARRERRNAQKPST